MIMMMKAIIDDDDNDGNNGDDVAYHSFQMSEEGAHTRVTSRGSVLGADCFKLYWAQKSRKEHLTKCCSVLRRVQTTTPEGLPRAGKSALFCFCVFVYFFFFVFCCLLCCCFARTTTGEGLPRAGRSALFCLFVVFYFVPL